MAPVRKRQLFHFKHRKELMFAEFEERIALTAALQFEIENVLVKRLCFLDVVHFDGDMVHSIDMYTHSLFYSLAPLRARVRLRPGVDLQAAASIMPGSQSVLAGLPSPFYSKNFS